MRRHLVAGLPVGNAAIAATLGRQVPRPASPSVASPSGSGPGVPGSSSSRGGRHGALRCVRMLSRRGAQYGLCRIRENEPWHYEPRSDAVDRGCPRMYTDPTQDPRTR
jgi:hypothetical protein